MLVLVLVFEGDFADWGWSLDEAACVYVVTGTRTSDDLLEFLGFARFGLALGFWRQIKLKFNLRV